MSGPKDLFSKYTVAVTLIALFAGLGSALAVQDQFTVDLGKDGGIVAGDGTGFNHGTWYYYPTTDRLVQWFFNGELDRDRRKVIEVDLTIEVLDPKPGASGIIEASLLWAGDNWPASENTPPLPDAKDPGMEQKYIQERVLVERTDVRQSLFINASFEIKDYCPPWVAIHIRGENIRVEGRVRHDCVPKDGPIPPSGDRDFGDAPEGAIAYPSLAVKGLFPTCVGIGPASWIEHDSKGQMRFGAKVDVERDGNAGKCPTFAPDMYNGDEGMSDGDAGLIKPRAYTIKGPVGGEDVYPLIFTSLESMGNACYTAIWGATLDIEVHNNSVDERDAYVNVLMDWDHSGIWQGAVRCGQTEVPEHVLVNFRVPNGYSGPLSGLNPPHVTIGPFDGYVWARFTISEQPVQPGWNGDGVFRDGETEDYLLHVKETPVFCTWRDGDPHKMHWAQLPDTQVTGIDIDLFASSLAEDFRCAQNGPITDVHFWGSFKDDVIPDKGTDSLTFEVNIYSDLLADSQTLWNRPGQLLWTKQVPRYSYDVSEVTNNIREGWFVPASKFYERGNHKRTFQYNICFDPEDELFHQRLGQVYWIEIKVIPSQDAGYTFGWKTTRQSLQFNAAGVWRHPQLGWLPLAYPQGHEYDGRRMDLSLVITGTEPEDGDFGDAPDPTYPTLSLSNGARHTIAPGIYLGKGVDGETDGQPNAAASGDDNDGNDDEDGAIFTTDLVPGAKAIVEVTASTQGVLNAWIDWNADGDWDDAGEQLFDDRVLAAGVNALPFDVPVSAVRGRTFTRFRFSKVRGLGYTGLAPDGEVEDHQVEIVGGVVTPKPPVDHLKWSQPPLEWDPTSRLPVYCGWDEPAYVSKPLQTSIVSWRLVADDFRCVGSMPVTSVHWWGSYHGWQEDEAPRVRPESWRIGFWSNVPADNRYPFSRPGRLLWVVNAKPDSVEVEKVGLDEFPQKPTDTTFQYFVQLQPHEYFWQDRFLTSTRDNTFWISITAVYTGSPGPQYPWGWKTRPQPWMDAAVVAEFRRDDLRAEFELDAASARPITNSLICERLDKYDMAFELDTDPQYVKWEQPFTGIRDWAHYEDEESLATEGPRTVAKWLQPPDTSGTGIDVDITNDIPPTWPTTVAADDFECKESGPITGIALWASWYHDVLSSSSAENVMFTLSLRQDIPADRSATGYSMPGPVLWRKQFSRGEFTVEPTPSGIQGYYSPANDVFEHSDHRMLYKYTFKIDPDEAFRQTGTEKDPVVYWLAVQARLIHSPGSVATRLGWKTSTSHWNDAAVWVKAEEPYSGSSWNKLQYPKDHPLSGRPIDLAFAIETEKAGVDATFRRIVADDWRCSNDLPVSSIVWWGSYIGYGYRPCECQQAPIPRRPDYFLLSIWTDAPDAKSFSRPGRKIWEYKAETFDEVMVGFDKHPDPTSSAVRGFEPVYRYTVRLPESKWFRQEGQDTVCWLSVVAVYQDPKTIVYPWGWTNHARDSWDVAAQTLLAHWKLDETVGLVAADSSGNGNHGNLAGDPVWRPASGWLGGALDFDGRNDYVRVTKPKGFDFAPNSFSASAWIYPRETRGQWHAILEYDRSTYNGNRFGLWLDVEGRLHFRVGLNTWQTPQALTPDAWHHVTATYNAHTQEMKLYVNGLFEAKAVYQRGFVTPTLATLVIGARGLVDDEYFNGLMDDIRVYKSVLSDEDILMLAGAGRNGGAVSGRLNATGTEWDWTQLLDQTGLIEDMSFLLFTEPAKPAVQAPSGPTGLPGEIVFYSEKK